MGTFKFCDPLECFLQFRLVCKPWKNAEETIRFDKFNNTEVLEVYLNYPHFLSKFLKVFKKLWVFDYNLPQNVQWDILGPLIVNNTKSLNEVRFFGTLDETNKIYCDQILQ